MSDFNDMAVADGLESVKAELQHVIAEGPPPAQREQVFPPLPDDQGDVAVGNDQTAPEWPDPILPGVRRVPDIPSTVLPGWVGDMAHAVAEST